MKIYQFFAVTLVTLAFTACSSNQPANVANTTNTTVQNTAATPAPSVQQSTSPTDSAAVSPTEVFRAQNEANRKKDAAAMKQNLSKDSLAMLEKAAQEEKMTVDQLLIIDNEEGDDVQNFETRNEKIDGNNATVEIRTAADEDWTTMPFVKEDGRWKIAMDKFMNTLREQMQAEEADETKEETKPESK